jgi:GNAT superfamily N-acetyltransferase
MTLRIRMATADDIPFLVETRLLFMEALWNKPVAEDVKKLGREEMPGQFESMLDKNLFCFLAEQDGQFVSIAYFYVMQYLFNPKFPTGRIGRLSNVYTPLEHRNKGYARALLKHVIQIALDLDLDVITLDASDVGKPLYEELGFVEDNLDQHLPMTLKLA